MRELIGYWDRFKVVASPLMLHRVSSCVDGNLIVDSVVKYSAVAVRSTFTSSFHGYVQANSILTLEMGIYLVGT